MALKLMYITNNPAVAHIAELNSVDRIWIDLEILGKKQRQANFDSVKSNHSMSDVSVMRNLISSSDLLVRINPLYDRSQSEVDEVVSRGADIVMLPMYRTADDAKRFVDMVNGRARTMLLLETIDAEKNIEQTLSDSGADEIHIGLNDLHIEYKMKFMFELLSNGKVDEICKKIRQVGVPYGFGGIGGLNEGGLVPGRIIVAEHYRVGSSMIILSRSFCDTGKQGDLDRIEEIFSKGMKEIREYEKTLSCVPASFFENNQKVLKEKVKKIVQNLLSIQS